MDFEWDVGKAKANFSKHGVRFPEAQSVLEDDDDAITIVDNESDPSEERFVTIGMGAKQRLLVVVYRFRGRKIRIISARPAEGRERRQYEEKR